jgi:hypothetical protein
VPYSLTAEVEAVVCGVCLYIILVCSGSVYASLRFSFFWLLIGSRLLWSVAFSAWFRLVLFCCHDSWGSAISVRVVIVFCCPRVFVVLLARARC